MKISIEGQPCSLGCMYAEGPLSKCLCACGGTSHGVLTGKVEVGVRCSPAVEKRCKAGNEDGTCKCACKGVNHGLYREIEDFSSVRINDYAL